MLHLQVDGRELFDESKNEFIQLKPQTLVMEHSLLSIAKWESKWKKPFLDDKDKKTTKEYLDYFRCMTISPKVDPFIYNYLSKKNIEDIKNYIDDDHTATTFNVNGMLHGSNRGRKITSELVYYWMIANNIPTEYEKWHFGRLWALIRICRIENDPKKHKMSKSAIMRQNHELNAARRAQYHTKG